VVVIAADLQVGQATGLVRDGVLGDLVA